MRPRDRIEWTDERVEILTKMYAGGEHTTREIAIELGDESLRNAVIGKANKLGLSRPTKSSVTRNARKAEREAVIKLDTRPRSTNWQEPVGCRFIEKDPRDPDWEFCQREQDVGQSYCGFHHQLAYLEPQPRAPRAFKYPNQRPTA